MSQRTEEGQGTFSAQRLDDSSLREITDITLPKANNATKTETFLSSLAEGIAEKQAAKILLELAMSSLGTTAK